MITKEYLDKKFKEQDEQTKRYMRMLSEDFQSKVRMIGEQYLSIKEKLDATFEMTGETKEEVEMIKIDIRIMKQDIKDLKKNDAVMNKNIIEIKKKLDYKTDLEVLNELEDRVVLLERKFATA